MSARLAQDGSRRAWTMDERKLAFFLYCQLPFGKMHKGNPDVQELARILRRTPSAVAMKLTNLASLDPAIVATGRKGLKGVAAEDRAVWALFHSDWQGLAEECERLVLQRSSDLAAHDQKVADAVSQELREDYTGKNRPVMTQRRVAQDFFRRAVLSSYDGKCCMSGVSSPKLLVASHIVPWKSEARSRLNPRNGLCLSSLHDRAFDQYLISLDSDFRVLVSAELKSQCRDPLTGAAFLAIEGKPISLPRRFVPEREFVDAHRREFVARNGRTGDP